MSARKRERKIPVDPALQDEKIKIKTELDDARAAASQKQTKAKKAIHINTSEVKIELLQETNLKDRTCKYCRQVFEDPLERLHHSRTCQDLFPMILLPPDEIERYFDSPDITQCPICRKLLVTRNMRSVFIKHLMVHTTGVTHQCSVCKKSFRRKGYMREHEKRHVVSHI